MQTIRLKLTEREYTINLSALAEVIGAIHADELSLRVGASLTEIGFVLESVRGLVSSKGPLGRRLCSLQTTGRMSAIDP